MARSIADEAGRSFTRAAEEVTPKITGRTAEAWEHDPVERVRTEAGERAWQSGTTNGYFIARFLEYGVTPHDMEISIDGRPVKIQHPGFRGMHLTHRAAAIVEEELPAIVAPRLSAWASGLEASASGRR